LQKSVQWWSQLVFAAAVCVALSRTDFSNEVTNLFTNTSASGGQFTDTKSKELDEKDGKEYSELYYSDILRQWAVCFYFE